MERLALILVLVMPSVAMAQGMRPRLWVESGFVSSDSRQGSETVAKSFPVSSELGTKTVTYPASGRSSGFALGGGVLVWGPLGVGANFSRVVSSEKKAGLFVEVPHPSVPHYLGSAKRSTSELQGRRDWSVDLSAVFDWPVANRLEVQFIGGLSIVGVVKERVRDFSYSQILELHGGLKNFVSIIPSSVEVEQVSGSGWGGHAGGVVVFLLTRNIGLTGGIVFRAGNVSVEEPFTNSSEVNRVRTMNLMIGARIRY